MLFSKLFCPIIKENPKDASIVSHSLMLKAGLIRQTASGIYAWLPLGLKVLRKVEHIIHLEMEKAGALNVLMPTIQSADIWRESGRYDAYGPEMLRLKDRHDREFLYGPTNEEEITKLFRDNVKSYKQFPMNLYQVQWKFRDEIRPRFGVMRGREFLMKDAYSFDLSQEQATISYKKMFSAYLKIFNTMGLQAIPMQADTGPIGGDLSHEFMILANTGESEVFCDSKILTLNTVAQAINYSTDVENIYSEYTKYYSATDEKHDVLDSRYVENVDSIVSMRGIEVGHIFYFGNKYSQSMGLSILHNGENINPLMGSYGIGVSRLLGAMIEASHDEKGIIWHKSVAPYLVMLNSLGNDEEVIKIAQSIYSFLQSNNIEVLYNDTLDGAGAKLNTADLLGFPYQINLGSKSLALGVVEVKNRKSGEVIKVAKDNLQEILKIILG